MEEVLEIPKKRRVREEFPEETETETISTAVKRLREDLILFDGFDGEFDSYSLDSFMKSLEDEIKVRSSPSAGVGAPIEVSDLASESGADLGFLLGASDGELGIPPSRRDDLVTVDPDSIGFGGGFLETPICESSDLGFEDVVVNDGRREVEDLRFEYPDPVVGVDYCTLESELEPILDDLFEIY